MTTATVAFTGQAALHDTNWHKAASGNWACLRNDNVEMVVHIATDPAHPWHGYVQHGQRGPCAAIGWHFKTADAAMDKFDQADGVYPAPAATQWKQVKPRTWARKNLHGDLLLILDTGASGRGRGRGSHPFHCTFSTNMGRGRMGQIRIVYEARSLSQAINWFDVHPGG